MNKENVSHTRYTLRAHIIVVFFSLLFLTFFIVVGYSYRSNSDAIISVGKKIITKNQKELSEKINKIFLEAQDFSNICSRLYNSQDEVSIENIVLVESMREVLRNHKRLTLIYTGTKDGRFIQIRRVTSDEFYRGDPEKKLPNGAAFAIRFIDNSISNPKEMWVYEDSSRKILATEKLPAVTFDHRTQQWYKTVVENGLLHWSDIYVFSSSQKPGITVSNPVYNDREFNFIGVLSLDIELDEISRFLKQYKTTENSRLFIVNAKSEVIAHSDAKQAVKMKGQKAQLNLISELDDKLCYEAFSEFEKNKKSTFVFNLDSKSYLATLSDFPKIKSFDCTGLEIKADEYNKEWKLVNIVPIDDLIGELQKTQSKALQIAGILLIVSLAVMSFLAKRISKPIVSLAEESKKIIAFNLDSNFEIKSAIYEISVLNDAVLSMRHSMKAFSKFIPKVLVGKLLKNNQEIKVGGKNQRVTFLFTDVAGFTPVCESYPPDKLALHISEYFEEVTKIIFKYNGTIDKYIGDSVMAFFGAPVKDKDQTLNACKASVGIQKRLFELNQQWAAQDKPILETRIGIHVGYAVIGNMGSSDRINYSALGDSVNLAARLENTNKFYKTNIIISEDVFKEVRDNCLARRLDVVSVKGKSSVTNIYELQGITHSEPHLLPSKIQISFCLKFEKCFQLYLEKRWDEAIEELTDLQKEFGDNHSISIYLNRCEKFKKDPPPEDWDFVVDFNV